MNHPLTYRLLGTLTLMCGVIIGLAERRYPWEAFLHGMVLIVMGDVMELKKKTERRQ